MLMFESFFAFRSGVCMVRIMDIYGRDGIVETTNHQQTAAVARRCLYGQKLELKLKSIGFTRAIIYSYYHNSLVSRRIRYVP